MANIDEFKQLYEQNKELVRSGKPDTMPQNKLLEIGTRLSWQELNKVRSELEPDWARPKWYVAGSGDKPDRQKENYYSAMLMGELSRLKNTNFVLLGRPDQQNATHDPTQESHDFDYRDSAGGIVALEVTRLLEEEGISIAHPRRVSGLTNFWKDVERQISSHLNGKFIIIHCPLLPISLRASQRRELVIACSQELRRIMVIMNVGDSQNLQTIPLLTGTVITKLSADGSSIENVGFSDLSRPLWETNRVVEYFFNNTLPGKNSVLRKAKQHGKATILLVCLDYPFVSLSMLSEKSSPRHN